MAFTREELESYEKGQQRQIDDKVSPFRGAIPAKAADPAAIAAVAAGQVDATPGGTAAAAAQATTPDDSPVVDEDGTLGDPTASGEGTSDANSADSSTAAVDPGDETDPNADLTGGEGGEEDPASKPAPKKGSAAERIVELNDLMEGYKVFGRHMQDQLKDALAENARLRGGNGTAAASTDQASAPPAVEADEPMPDLSDEDVQFDNDKYRAKLLKWQDARTERAVERAVRKITGNESTQKTMKDVEKKCVEFAKDHDDFDDVVTKNPVLAANQLCPDAAAEVAESEFTADLLYRFGKDRGLAIRTARMTPRQQVAQVVNMIRDIQDEKRAAGSKPNGQKPQNQQGGAKPAQKKSITQAPPPPRPTPAGGRADGRSVTDPNMSMDEFARLHREGKKSARETARQQRGLR